ncbi:hypothetical protein [Uruburuella suis]|uniref:hypothetical protein n=1 Tax=Uruburuella suis TaxID=252130 RepID=UPI002491BA6B|nr:hypothetical protein [Uruburuella suis]
MQLYQTSTHDLFSDAFFILHDRLMFASMYGRDANVLSLFGLLTGDDGIDALGFRLSDSQQYHPANTTAHQFWNLQKRMTKLHTHNYGVLTHVFLVAEELVEPDQMKKVAWIISDDLHADINKMIWAAVLELADVPLLSSWSVNVLEMLNRQSCLQMFIPGTKTAEMAVIGVQACKISLPADFDRQVSHMLKTGLLGC